MLATVGGEQTIMWVGSEARVWMVTLTSAKQRAAGAGEAVKYL